MPARFQRSAGFRHHLTLSPTPRGTRHRDSLPPGLHLLPILVVTEGDTNLLAVGLTVTLLFTLMGILDWALRFRRKKGPAPAERPELFNPPPPATDIFRPTPAPAPRDLLASRPRSTAPAPLEAFPPSSNNPQARPVILVASQDSFVRTELHRQLHQRYSVVEADDSIDILELARSLQPALVITTSPMDAAGACVLCDQLKGDPGLKQIPVLWIAPAAGLPNVEDFNVSAEDTLTGMGTDESLPIRVENLVEVRHYLHHGGLPEVHIDADDTAARLADTLFLEMTHRIVDEHIDDRLFGLEALAREAQVSLQHLESRLLRLTRLSAAGFLRTKRLQHAVRQLEAGKTPEEAAQRTGFHSVTSFKRLFKQVVGVAPEDYTRP